MIWIWLGVVISLLLIEYMSRNFTAICFAISGTISCILTHYQDKYNIQLMVFLIGGIFLILVVRPYFLKKLEEWKRDRVSKKNEERKVERENSVILKKEQKMKKKKKSKKKK